MSLHFSLVYRILHVAQLPLPYVFTQGFRLLFRNLAENIQLAGKHRIPYLSENVKDGENI